MRHLLLTALLAGMPLVAPAADDAAINDLVRRPVNTVDPIDGRPIDTKLQPVTLIGSDGLDVQVGCSTEANQRILRAKFGDEAYDAIRAAKGNTTISALKPATPAGAPGASSGLASAPQASGTTSSTWNASPQGSSLATPSYLGTPSTSPYHTGSTGSSSSSLSPDPWNPAPATLGGSSTSATTSTAATKSKSKAKHHGSGGDAHITTSHGVVEYTDERQVEKKAAQRRDLGEREDGESGSAPAPVHHKSKHKSTTKSATSASVSGASGMNQPIDPWAPKASGSTGSTAAGGTSTNPNPFNPPASSYSSPGTSLSPAPSSAPAPASTPAPASPGTAFTSPAPAPSSSPLPAPAPATLPPPASP